MKNIKYFLFLFAVILFQCCFQQNRTAEVFPIILQESSIQCGPVCVQMIGKFYGRNLDINQLEKNSNMDYEGTSLLGLEKAADAVGLRTMSIKIPIKTVTEEIPLPAIAHWNGNHFIVIYQITQEKIFVADPARGKLEYSIEDFCKGWLSNETPTDKEGIIMLFETTDRFYNQK